jgi:hypothetical protein
MKGAQIFTLTTLSHPQEMMTGLRGLGLKRTQDTLERKVSLTVQICVDEQAHHSE